MLTAATIDATARAYLETHRTRARYGPLDPALRAGPLEDAYRIQDVLHRLMADAGRGEIAGWKVALTSKAMQELTGVDQPAAGAIFSMFTFVFSWVTMSTVAGNSTLPLT